MFISKKSKCSQHKPLPKSLMQSVAEVKETITKEIAPKKAETKPAPKKKGAVEEPVAEEPVVENKEEKKEK